MYPLFGLAQRNGVVLSVELTLQVVYRSVNGDSEHRFLRCIQVFWWICYSAISALGFGKEMMGV